MTKQVTCERKCRWMTWGAAGVLSTVGIASLWFGHGLSPTWADATAGSPAAVAHANSLSTAFRAAAERVLPSVVTIQVQQETAVTDGMSQGNQQMPEELAPLLKRFFGEDLPQMQSPQPHRFRQEGMGSGVIIDKSGIILTNNHVAGGGGKVVVRLHDGREFVAKEVKTDPKSDLAIVRIEGAGELPVAQLGDSDVLQIGDWVLAVGSPFGLDETVTAGIISAKSRGMGITEREDFLQTDAAINPGNSGGPLVNLDGQVVGINTAISTRGGGSDGIGFAVPINLANWVSHQLVDKGAVERAFLGVGIQKVDNDLSRQLGLTTLQGALVTEVRPETAAAQAGLMVGDVIVSFDGHDIREPRSLQNVVERASLQNSHKLVVIRNGERKELQVLLTSLPTTVTASEKSTIAAPAKSEFEQLGLEVSNLTSDVAEQLGMQDAQGVVITSVASGSAADDVGLQSGMVIARVGTKDVSSVEDFRAAVKDVDLKSGLLLLVKSPNGSQFIVLKN
ncbi:MAG: Do family serine endopeptidase [Planctomycetaceae bacterium]